MPWRIGLVDSCGDGPDCVAASRFERCGAGVLAVPVAADVSGHGTRLGRIIAGGPAEASFVFAQVLDQTGRTSADVVAAGIDWCIAQGVDLVHLSLGLTADRPVLRDAIARALATGCVLVAAVPARGAVPYPAAYPGVLRATGDARCDPRQVSWLSDTTFGGCPSVEGTPGGGASVGAAHVSRAIAAAMQPCDTATVIATLALNAAWRGPECRSVHPDGA